MPLNGEFPSNVSGADITSNTNLYGYTPSRGAGFVFVILFIATTRKFSCLNISGPLFNNVRVVLHVFQAGRSRAWWLFPTLVIAGVAEVVGWVARTKSSYDATARLGYIIQ